MKASELIGNLIQAMGEHGDIEIAVWNPEWCRYEKLTATDTINAHLNTEMSAGVEVFRRCSSSCEKQKVFVI